MLTLGACLSLTGRYARFGRQAANGLRVWQQIAGGDTGLAIADDGSDPEAFAARLRLMASRCDVLLGPYSTQLLRAGAGAMPGIDRLLWNHGGAGDDVQVLCPGRIVSVPAPATRYATPFVRDRTAQAARAPLWVVRGRGRFGRQVAAGAVDEARRDGLEAIEKGTSARFEDVPAVWDLFSCGRFEDDVGIVKAARAVASPPRAICSVAAGVRDFAAELDDVDGMYGVAQWHPGRGARPELGPSEDEFLRAYRELAQAEPDYPAVQAAAGAVLAMRCVELAGSTKPDALWAVAAALDTTTLLGAFKIDASTGAQTRHTTALVQWRGGALQSAARTP